MIDRIHVQGNDVAFDDDFEWVNAWAAADKPQGKPRDQRLIAPSDAPLVEARSAAPREEKMPAVAIARNAEGAAEQGGIMSVPRAIAAAGILSPDAVSFASPTVATVASPTVATVASPAAATVATLPL